jgi:hypothetical protein
MLVVGLSLEVGTTRNGKFVFGDAFDMSITGPAEWDCDSVNDLLSGNLPDDYDYAQLKFFYNDHIDTGFLVASFQRIKLKGKGYKWVLTD